MARFFRILHFAIFFGKLHDFLFSCLLIIPLLKIGGCLERIDQLTFAGGKNLKNIKNIDTQKTAGRPLTRQLVLKVYSGFDPEMVKKIA